MHTVYFHESLLSAADVVLITGDNSGGLLTTTMTGPEECTLKYLIT